GGGRRHHPRNGDLRRGRSPCGHGGRGGACAHPHQHGGEQRSRRGRTRPFRAAGRHRPRGGQSRAHVGAGRRCGASAAGRGRSARQSRNDQLGRVAQSYGHADL
ncbi:MAG: hypothetical protein AVDCRST_MAG91-2163, partial [uncultured Sphingomonadaceae bacterium]